jgi:hypothetical protein
LPVNPPENMCMLNGKISFDIPNVPADHVQANILFAFIYEVVSRGKGMLLIKIDPSKSQTINCLMNETFPAIECFNNEELPIINPKIVGYFHHALVIDCISIVFEDSITTRALEHESAMADAYNKMKPGSIKWQLQAILTTSGYYEDIKGVQGPAVAARPRLSSADSRTKRTTPATRVQTPTPAPARRAPAPHRRTPPPLLRAPQPAGRLTAAATTRRPPALPARRQSKREARPDAD